MSKILAKELESMYSVTRRLPVRNIADKRNMVMGSVNFNDKSSLKIIANKTQLNAVIMKNGKVLSAKGIQGTNNKIIKLIKNLYEHFALYRRGNLEKGADDKIAAFMDDYAAKYGIKTMYEI